MLAVSIIMETERCEEAAGSVGMAAAFSRRPNQTPASSEIARINLDSSGRHLS